MPDEPTKGAGDGGSSSATFRRGVERADQTTSDEPPRPADTAEPARRSYVPPRQPPPGAPPRPTTPVPPGGSGGMPPTGPSTSSTAAQSVVGAGAAATAAGTTPVGEGPDRGASPARRRGRVRARKVRRILRHIDPWSVLKISLLFYAALFVIICVASAVLWNAARSAGTVDDVESFITEVGGFGKCEPIDGASPTATTTTTAPGAAPTAPVDQFDPAGGSSTTVAGGVVEEPPEDEESCREGEELVGEFRFEDGRIFQAFALGGIVLVLAGSAANVVLALLFNLMSDLTGGLRVTVLEEDPPPRSGPRPGSPRPARRD